MSFSSHQLLLTSSPNGLITVYDTISGNILARFTGSRSPRHGLSLLGNSYIAASHISSATASGSIHLYNWWTPSAFHLLPLPEPVAPLASSPHHPSFLFAGGLSGSVYALSIPSGNILKSFPAHKKSVSSLIISTDSSLLISGGDDGFIVAMPIFQFVSDISSNTLSACCSFHAHYGPVTSISCCMGLCNPTIVSCSTDCTCKLWSLSDGTKLHTVAFPCAISGIVLDQTETEFYAAGSDGFIYKGSFQVGSRKEVMKGNKLEALGQKHGGAVVAVMIVNEGNNLVSAAEDGSVYIWDIERGEVSMVLGNQMDMETISDVALAKGIGNEFHKVGDGSLGLSSQLLCSKPIKDAADLVDVPSLAANDKKKAINMLEGAIGMYERLLKLILKEAKRKD